MFIWARQLWDQAGRKELQQHISWREKLINTCSILQWTVSSSLSKLTQPSSQAWLQAHQHPPAFHVSVTHTSLVSAGIPPLSPHLIHTESELFWKISAMLLQK